MIWDLIKEKYSDMIEFFKDYLESPCSRLKPRDIKTRQFVQETLKIKPMN